MSDIAGWIAAVATVIAAMMTAANLGARVTGWGFVIFVAGSICWSLVGIGTGQTNLLWTNGFLTLVNLIGVWRWLGRQASYSDGGEAASRQSASANVPTLFSASSLMGSPVLGPDGDRIGVIVDTMARCDTAQLSYVVISEGGVGGVGERLHAVHPTKLRFAHDEVASTLTSSELAVLPVLHPGRWPAALPVA